MWFDGFGQSSYAYDKPDYMSHMTRGFNSHHLLSTLLLDLVIKQEN